jgi:hypothetical protein
VVIQDDETTSAPLLRARPPQVLLGVGATLLVTAGATAASISGGSAAHWALIVLAAVAAALSVVVFRKGLRSSGETLAACAAGLGLAASDLGEGVLTGNPVPALVLVGLFLGMHVVSHQTIVWPLAAWAAGQLAVLRLLHLVPASLHTEVFLSVALVGLGIALTARQVVARVGLVTSSPWWLAGVVGGSSTAWGHGGAEQWLSAVLMIAAAGGLLMTRTRDSLIPLLGPPRAVPLIAGVVAGAATTGAFSSLGTLSMTLTGYAGVLIATVPAGYLSGSIRARYLPVALAGGITMAALCLVQLIAASRWSALSLLLVLTAIPTVLVAVRKPEDRPEAVPTAVGCLAGAVLLAMPDGILAPGLAAAALTALYVAAMAVGSALQPSARKTTAVAAAACAGAALLVLVARGSGTAVAAHLSVQGLATIGWAVQSGRHPDAGRPEADGDTSGAWRIGAIQLVLAFWIGAADAGFAAVEWYSLPAAAALLLGAGPRLVEGPSWPSWGPGLLVAAVPSTLVASATGSGPRATLLLMAASAAMVCGARAGVRAPLLVGAGTALALAVGLAVRQLPWPLGIALVIGSVLLALGTFRERFPVAFFGARLADLR